MNLSSSKKTLKDLNIYLVMNILSYFELYVNNDLYNPFTLLHGNGKRSFTLKMNDLYGKFGYKFKKNFFIWKTCRMKVNRNLRITDSYINKDKLVLITIIKNSTNLKYCLSYYTSFEDFDKYKKILFTKFQSISGVFFDIRQSKSNYGKIINISNYKII